jgi:SAM-dependent methyltransferase
MSADSSDPGSLRDPTFRSYKPDQAAAYAKGRGSYPEALYRAILEYHHSKNAGFDVILDVGCGTGGATRDLAGFFSSAIGTDPGQAMISQAIQASRLAVTASGTSVQYEVLAAEELHVSNFVKVGSVDLLKAAMSV